MKTRIAISRSLAAEGEEVGRCAAAMLGFRYVDDEIISGAAEKAGVTSEQVQRAERSPGLVERILETMATAQPAEAGAWNAEALYTRVVTAEAVRLIEDVVRQTAEQGNVVILAHGASIPLAGMDGLLRVFVTASEPVRIKRWASATGLSAAEARKAISESDRQRREYFRRFYRLQEELPTHYDLILNTDGISPTHAAELVVLAAKL